MTPSVMSNGGCRRRELVVEVKSGATGKALGQATQPAGRAVRATQAESPTLYRSANARIAPNAPAHYCTDNHTTPTMQSIPDARQQSFEELYGPPENFLEIEVCAPP